jgi:hypothetical protein
VVHVPIRGLFFLTRAAVLVAAVAAVPVLLRRCAPLAKQVGDFLVDAGEKMRKADEAPRERSTASEPAPKAQDSGPGGGKTKTKPAAAPKPSKAKPKTSKPKRPPSSRPKTG